MLVGDCRDDSPSHHLTWIGGSGHGMPGPLGAVLWLLQAGLIAALVMMLAVSGRQR